MNKITKRSIVSRAMDCGMTALLARRAMNQFGDFEYFKECAPNIVNHGIDGGFGGYIYYNDTVSFAQKNLKDILEFSKRQASEYGMPSHEMIAGFNCFKGEDKDEIIEAIYNKECDLYQTVMNGLTWYIGEEISRIYCDMVEENA